MIQKLHQIWIDLGQPSYVSAFNCIWTLVYLVNKLMDVMLKDKKEQEFAEKISKVFANQLAQFEESKGTKSNL